MLLECKKNLGPLAADGDHDEAPAGLKSMGGVGENGEEGVIGGEQPDLE